MVIADINLLLKQEIIDILKAGWEIFQDIYKIKYVIFEKYVVDHFIKDGYFQLWILGESQGLYLPNLDGLESIVDDIQDFLENGY